MKTKAHILLFGLLAVALVTASCVSKKKYNTEVTTANKYATLNQQLMTALNNNQKQLDSDQIQITQLQNQLKVTLVNEVMFPEGGYQLTTSGKEVLASIAPTLAGLKGQQIVVQGFTDNVPIEGELKLKYPTNLALSSARADNVATYLTIKGVPNSIISAQGFGEQRPVAPNDSPADRAKNRRVEIIIKDASQQ